jgi:hypothetical protein
MNAVQTLMRHSIDYAGLFPPAGLDLQTAAGNYARYLESEWHWALGRFILPAGRLGELEDAAGDLLFPAAGAPRWRISALASSDLAADLEQIDAFNRRHRAGGAAVVDTIEAKGSSVSAVEGSARQVPQAIQLYLEIPIDSDPAELIGAVRRVGARAKARTGGVTRDAFPSSQDLIRFIGCCTRVGVPFKATAGLHHPWRGEYRLTYAAESPRGRMFGFLNVLLAAAFMRNGMVAAEAVGVLEEASPAALEANDRGVAWRGHPLTTDALRSAREDTIASFGSCSFTEPIEDLLALHLLEPRVQQA